MFPDKKNITVDVLKDELFTRKSLAVSVMRLDKIHPIISGNKLFKLHFFLEEANASTHKTIITFGGAYSNHLVATAFACHQLGLINIGIVRGEKPAKLSHTLEHCIRYGMQLKFVSWDDYSKKTEPVFLHELSSEFGKHVLIPEGGYHPLGAKGASLIMDLLKDKNYSHVCCAVGTATTLAGLLVSASKQHVVTGFTILKNMHDIDTRLRYLIDEGNHPKSFLLNHDYSFGGYAKHTPALLQFINTLYEQQQLPTDFVYTGKMMFGIYDMIKKDQFPEGSNIICIHTGGLQGNLSLPANSLVF